MNNSPLGAFAWSVGIENTFIPQERPGIRSLDEYELVEHYDKWREDAQLAANLGVKFQRWGLPWYRVEREPGVFDWSWVDQVIPYMVRELGINPIVDLVHYGTPMWLSFTDPGYPAAVRRLANAFSRRYRDLVRFYTPLNEPTITAHMCGRVKHWPPFLEGEQGYVRILLAITHGMQLTMRAVKRNRPDAVFVSADAMGFHHAASKKAEEEVNMALHRDLLAWDLVRGAVNATHPLYRFLRDNGASGRQLQAMRRRAIEQDVLGFAIYPWSLFNLVEEQNGGIRWDRAEYSNELFAKGIERIYAKAQKPLFISETSCPGYWEDRIKWMKNTAQVVVEARAKGIPFAGYCWFPLITMIDWDYQRSGKPVFEHLLHLGIYDLVPENGSLKRVHTPLVDEFKAIVRTTEFGT